MYSFLKIIAFTSQKSLDFGYDLAFENGVKIYSRFSLNLSNLARKSTKDESYVFSYNYHEYICMRAVTSFNSLNFVFSCSSKVLPFHTKMAEVQ